METAAVRSLRFSLNRFRFSRSLFELYAMYDWMVAESFDGRVATAYITRIVEQYRA
jgi:hypothetical protein